MELMKNALCAQTYGSGLVRLIFQNKSTNDITVEFFEDTSSELTISAGGIIKQRIQRDPFDASRH
jgi:hypothetical protein